MRILRTLAFVLITVLFLSSVTSASKPTAKKSLITKDVINNLMAGVESDNFGLKTSAAYYLGEYQCSEAVLPLLKILKSDSREEARITAALALFKINDARGIFAVKQAIRFDESSRVKKICGNLYREYLNPQETPVLNYAAY
jgi:HEAT repeat protein